MKRFPEERLYQSSGPCKGVFLPPPPNCQSASLCWGPGLPWANSGLRQGTWGEGAPSNLGDPLPEAWAVPRAHRGRGVNRGCPGSLSLPPPRTSGPQDQGLVSLQSQLGRAACALSGDHCLFGDKCMVLSEKQGEENLQAGEGGGVLAPRSPEATGGTVLFLLLSLLWLWAKWGSSECSALARAQPAQTRRGP